MVDRLEIICLTHRVNDLVLERYRSLSRVANANVILYADRAHCDLEAVPADVNIKTFDIGDIVKTGYRPLGKGVVPGSNHFPVIEHAAECKARFTWCIEYDVDFNGAWQTFFDAHAESDTDFLSTQFHTREEDPHWYWWKSLKPPEASAIDSADICFVRSFNPVYRLSQQAALCLQHEFKGGWTGHQEVSMATLLLRGGFTVEDFGGFGSFARRTNHGMWYQSRTFNHQRATLAPTDERTTNMLFHPMKTAGCAHFAKAPPASNVPPSV